MRILRGKDSVAAMTIGAGCGSSVSIRHRSSMHALSIEFHGMRERNLVPREKLLVAVTGSASVRQILLSYRRSRVARGLNLMHRTVAGAAVRCVRITFRGRLSMYAFAELLHFIGVTLRAFSRRRLDRRNYLVRIAVARLASLLAKRAMNAASHMGSLVAVTTRALNLCHFVGMGIILDARVAVVTGQSAVDTSRVFSWINRNALAAGR